MLKIGLDMLIISVVGLAGLVLIIYLLLVWLGFHYKIHRSLRLRVEAKHLRDRLTPLNNKFSFRYAGVQLLEYGYSTFGGIGLIGQLIVAGLSVLGVLIVASIATAIAKEGISILQLAPFDSSTVTNLWQVQATVVTLAFVVAIFFWESLLSETPYEEVLRLFIRYSHSIFGLTFSLTATAVSGIMLLHHSKPNVNDTHLSLFLGYSIVLLSGCTAVVVLVMFRRTAGLLVYDDDKYLVNKYARLGLEEELTPSNHEIERSVRHRYLGVQRSLSMGGMSSGQYTEFKASELEINGVIMDLDIHALSDIVNLVEKKGLSVDSVPQIGRDLRAAQDPTLLSIEGDLSNSLHQEIESKLKSAIITRQNPRLQW